MVSLGLCPVDVTNYPPESRLADMGLFDFLSGSDPSSDWADLGKQHLLVSLAEPSINGIELGAPANNLSRLGRPSNKRPFKEKHFRFESLGITIEIKNDLVSYFGLPVVRDPIENIGPCEIFDEISGWRGD